MTHLSMLILSLALLVGGAGAVSAYQSAADHPQTHTTSVAPAGDRVAATAAPAAKARHAHRHRQRVKVRWAPCPAGTTLDAGACVTDVVRTVTLPAPAIASSGGSASSGSAQTVHHGSDDHGGEHGDDGGHGEHEDRGEHGDDG